MEGEIVDNVSKYPLKYNEAALVLYFIGLEISNLLKEIKNKSPVATKQIPASFQVLIPEQIEEARQDFTGFVKNAIAVAAKRQLVMNEVAVQTSQVRELSLQIDGVLGLIVQNMNFVSKAELARINEARIAFKAREEEVLLIEKNLRESSEKINDLLFKHAEEWRQHHKKYVDKLVFELERQGVSLSNLEKQELNVHTKTMEEIKYKLVKAGILK